MVQILVKLRAILRFKKRNFDERIYTVIQMVDIWCVPISKYLN
jgi:hypothetical protein